MITTGTFLGGEIHLGKEKKRKEGEFVLIPRDIVGLKVWPAGRIGENPSIGLSKSLRNAGFKLGRLKTGRMRICQQNGRVFLDV